MDNNQVKSWLTSKTVWMSILGVLATLASFLGKDWFATIDQGVLAENLVNLSQAVFYILAAVFRVTADKKLTL